MTGPDPHRRTWVEQVMGLPVSVVVRGPGARARDDVATAVASAFARLHDADRVFSTYRPDSAVSRLRRGEVTVDRCPPEVAEVLRLCERARLQTGGDFDAHVTGRGLDPSGLVKAWAVERAAEALAGLDACDWAVNAGGDVLVSARHGEPWRIGVEDPRDRSRVLAVLHVRQGAVATSGSAARGDHVRDPRTGAPARALLGATVLGASLLVADVRATATLVRGSWSPVDGLEALLVDRDGGVTTSAGWPSRPIPTGP